MGIGALVLAFAASFGPGPSQVPAPLPASPPPPVETGNFKTRPVLPATPGGRGPRIARVGVPEPKTVGKVPARELAVLAQALVTEVRKVDGITAVGMLEIREMLTQEYRRQMLGCEVDQECLAEIAGALGVDELVSSELVVQSGLSTFTVTRVDMRSRVVIASAQKRLDRRRAGEEVLGVIGEVVATVFPDRPLKPGETRGIAPQVARWLNPPPLPKWVFYTTAGAVTFFGAGAAAYGLASNSTRADYNALVRSPSPLIGGELVRLEDRAKGQARTATILAGVAGGLALAAGVEGFFTDWHDARAAVTVGPGGATVRVRF